MKKQALPELDQQMQTISRYLDREGENGFSGVVLVKTPDHDPLIRCYGYANEEQLVPNSPQTAFNIGSITKQFTGAAILKLEMMGKLSVNDSVGRYLPSLSPDKQCITFHQLLTHTSGLPFDLGSESDVLTREGFMEKINDIQLICPPGAAYHYSHVGFSLLGILIEKISGTDYESFLRTHLFEPARMNLTGYRMPDWLSTTVAHGYRFCNDWGGPMDNGWLEDGPSWKRRAGGEMLSTIEDLYAWHEALLGNEILNESSKKKYYYPDKQVVVNQSQTAGYGWRVINTLRNTKVIAHNGWNGRFYSDFLRYLDDNVTIILLSNKFREGNQGIPYEIAKCIFWKDYQPCLVGSLTQCLDSLPDNRLGVLAGQFLSLIAEGNDQSLKEFIKNNMASHLMVKYGEDTLTDRMKGLQKLAGLVKIKQVTITDNQMMDVRINLLTNNQEGLFTFYFDKNEDYKIRGFRFETTE